MADAPLAVDAAWDDRCGPGLAKRLAEAVGIVAFVSDEAAEAGRLRRQQVSRADVGDVAGGQRERDGTAEEVADGMDLRGLPAAGNADGLRLRPPLPPCAERCAFT